jgi:hypothetical protein
MKSLEISSAMQRQLRQALEALVEHVGLCHTDVHWDYEVSSSEFFPIRAYAVALRDRESDADEVLILSILGHRPSGAEGDRLVLHADVSRGDGSLIAESPHRVLESLAPSASMETIEPRLEVEINILGRWLLDHRALVDEALAPVA